MRHKLNDYIRMVRDGELPPPESTVPVNSRELPPPESTAPVDSRRGHSPESTAPVDSRRGHSLESTAPVDSRRGHSPESTVAVDSRELTNNIENVNCVNNSEKIERENPVRTSSKEDNNSKKTPKRRKRKSPKSSTVNGGLDSPHMRTDMRASRLTPDIQSWARVSTTSQTHLTLHNTKFLLYTDDLKIFNNPNSFYLLQDDLNRVYDWCLSCLSCWVWHLYRRIALENEIELNRNLLLFQQQKFLKRTAEELEASGAGSTDGGFGEPPVKLQCTQAQHQHQGGGGGGGGAGGGGPHLGHSQHQTGSGANSTGPNGPGNGTGGGGSNSASNVSSGSGNSNANENLTKFSVEIVQQLEFTTSVANSQAQQISTNVTVKALTNASVKSDLLNASSSPKPDPTGTGGGNGNNTGGGGGNGRAQAGAGGVGGPGGSGGSNATGTSDGMGCVDISNLVECKQEPDNEFVDLEQCAAALEKDAAVNGAGFTGFSDFMGDDTGDEIIASDAFKELLSEISDFNPEFMKEFGFEDKCVDTIPCNTAVAVNSAYSGIDFKSEMSPAAQTLKQMAEQHQHKSQQLGLGGFNPTAAAAAAAAAARGPAARSPYAEFPQFSTGASDYLGSPGSAAPPGGQNQTPGTSGSSYHKNNGASGFQSQQTNDMFVGSQTQFAGGLPDMKRSQTNAGGKPSMLGPSNSYKQQYSPYGSPGSMPNHGSPGYPLPPRGSQSAGPNQTGSQVPFSNSTPPRPPSGPGTSTLQINQAQQLHINNPGHQIQVESVVEGGKKWATVVGRSNVGDR
ncbi:hypothetical protein M0802_003245 [Mischocyttarus mexicanus]|nr:hypothetical protein M0802_003245 [Mischocyttarus mexicanus]